MKHAGDNPYASHEDISLLLPWYVNKTLQGAELNAVERHLKVCLICKRELLNQQYLSAAVNQPSSFDSAAQASFSRFKNRLQTAKTEQFHIPPPEQTVAKPNTQQHIKKHLTVHTPTFALAASVLLAVLLTRVVNIEQLFSNDYRTLSDAETIKTNSNELRVIFKSDASQQVIEQILASIQGHIVDGPNAQSLYTIGFNSTDKSEQVMDKLELLRKNEHIVFAEPAYALLSNTQPEQTEK